MIKFSLLACLAFLFTNVLAMERTMILNNVGIGYHAHTFTLDRARTDVRIMQDNLEFRCGGLAESASDATTYPIFVSCSILRWLTLDCMSVELLIFM